MPALNTLRDSFLFFQSAFGKLLFGIHKVPILQIHFKLGACSILRSKWLVKYLDKSKIGNGFFYMFFEGLEENWSSSDLNKV